uniref:Uncharacterized protein n=1 Tax=Zea mays TaxID=4577 RepID=A0A804M4E4_MAIZE
MCSHAGWCQRHIQTPKQRSIDQSKLVGQNISCSTTTTMDKAYVAVLSFAFLFVIHYLVGRAGRKGNGKGKGTQRLPPSPPAVPFLGHLHLVKTPFHEALAGLAARHGPVFSMRMGSRRALVVSSPECAKECFTEHDVVFANRPRFATQDLVSFGGARRRRARPAQAEAVRGLPQRAHGDHRAHQDVPRRGGRRLGHVARGARIQADRRRDRAAPRHGQPVGLPAGAAVARRVRREEQDHGRCGQEGRVPAAAHRRGAAEAGRRRRRQRQRQEEHDSRAALVAEVRAGGVHGYHDHGTLRELIWRRNGDHVDHDRMGHVAPPEPPGGAEEGT